MNVGWLERFFFADVLSFIVGMQEAELLALLRDEQADEDKLVQTDISDEDLLKLMNRSDLSGPPGAADATPLIPLKGPGWEVVVPTKSGGGMLSALTSWALGKASTAVWFLVHLLLALRLRDDEVFLGRANH